MSTVTERRARWAAALRSGEYEQTQGVLARDELGVLSYCCLGVACEVAIQDGVNVEWTSEEGGNTLGFTTPTGSAEFGVLPPVVAKYYGTDSAGRLGDPEDYLADGIHAVTADNLTELNDKAKWDFNQIADVVENNLRKYW